MNFPCDKLLFRKLGLGGSKDSQPLWDQPVAEGLSGIVFVRDYLQLQFNPPPPINAYSARVVVSSDGRSAAFGEEAFANLAIGLIGHFVREVMQIQ